MVLLYPHLSCAQDDKKIPLLVVSSTFATTLYTYKKLPMVLAWPTAPRDHSCQS
jgi:hypothetical protein